MFLDHRKTQGNKIIKEPTMAKKEFFILVPKKTQETMNVATPTATFNA